MARRPPKTPTPLDEKQQELAQRENDLRAQMQKLQRMIEEAPRAAERRSRAQREEVVRRASADGSRLEASVALRDKRWGDEDWGVQRRRRSLRKERREGRIIFLVLVIALALAVLWLLTRFQF